MSAWKWIAYGKHPSARDYIRFGIPFPLGTTVFGWVEQGFSRCCRDGDSQHGIFWRFWLRGMARDQLTCGILCKSSDAIGRPYPLLLMGTGIFPKWEGCWEHLPLACKVVWDEAEALLLQESISVSEFVQGLGRLNSPSDILHDDTLPPVLPFKTLNGEIGAEFGLFSLEAPNGSSIAMAAAMRLSLLQKKRIITPPIAVFIGGGNTACMAILRRPLKPLDFEALWNLQQL